MNGTDARTIKVDWSFLGKSNYEKKMVSDKVPAETLVSFARKRLSFGSKIGLLIDKLPASAFADNLIVELLPGGGFVAVFNK